MNLTGMKITATLDRPYDSAQYISPGGYELNGKQFDFFTTYGHVIDDHTLIMEVSQFDYEFAHDIPITKSDVVSGTFDEFYIYTGEYDDPEVNILSIDGLEFYFDDGSTILADEYLLHSANACLEIENDLER